MIDPDGTRWRSLHARLEWINYEYDVSNTGLIRKWNRKVLEGSLCEPWDTTTQVLLRAKNGRAKRITARRIRQIVWPEVFGERGQTYQSYTPKEETVASLRQQVIILKRQLAEAKSAELKAKQELYYFQYGIPSNDQNETPHPQEERPN